MRPIPNVRSVAILAVAVVLSSSAQPQEPIPIEDLLASAFPSSLVAAADAERVAWVRTERGVRNVWVAQGPEFRGRVLTSYDSDDGQALGELAFLPGADALVFVRGGAPNREGELPNPESLPSPAERVVMVVDWEDGEPRVLGAGSAPNPHPRDATIAFLRDGQVWSVARDGDEPARLFQVRGSVNSAAWSPDGTRLVFSSDRGDHALVGLFDLAKQQVTWLDPSVDRDRAPVWSPSGRQVAFLRLPKDERLPFTPRREATPWSIRVVDVETGAAHDAFVATPGRGSVFRGVEGPPLHWAAGDRIVFPWEVSGWNRLYSVPAAGGEPLCLLDGGEVEHAALAPGGREVVFSCNHQDIERRHLYRASVFGGATRGPLQAAGIQWAPAVTPGGAIAYFAADARIPAHAQILPQADSWRRMTRSPAPWPGHRLVDPRPVSGQAQDGVTWYGQLFEPADLAAGERRPAVIFMHGGSRRQMMLGWHNRHYYHQAYAFNQHLASRGYVVLALNYRSGIGYGLEFREALDYGAQGASEYRDVAAAGRWLAAQEFVDAGAIGLWGGSYGGYLTALGLAHDSDLFAAGVDLHGVHDWNVVVKNFVASYDPAEREEFARLALDSSPMAHLDGWRSPVLMVHGDDDRNVPFSETVDLAAELRARGVGHELMVLPDEVHSFLLHSNWLRVYRRAAEFLDQHLKGAPSEAALVARARAIHRRVLTLDTHKDISQRLAPETLPDDPREAARWKTLYDPNVWGAQQVDFPKSRAGGLDVAFYIVYVGQGALDEAGFARAYEQALAKFEAIHRMARLYPDQIALATSPDEVEAVAASGRLVACIGIENGYCMGTDLDRIEQFHLMGARYMSIAHNGHSQLGDSHTPEEPLHGGLSELGRAAIAELNRVGIMVDVSHASKESMMQAAALSLAPVIASHSGADGVQVHGRNLDDEQLRALAATGGVIQCVAFASYVKANDERDEAIRALRDEMDLPRRRGGDAPDTPELIEKRRIFRERVQEIEARYPRADVADFVDHIEHAIAVVGIDHVAISSDFDGGGGVTGWNDASETLNVTLELVRRGYGEEQIALLWSGNTLRMWREVEQVAARLQAGEDR